MSLPKKVSKNNQLIDNLEAETAVKTDIIKNLYY